MASYYPPPSSPFSGAGRNTAPDPYQRPSSGLIDKLQAYPPNGYTSAPPAASPLQPYMVQPARVPGRSYSPRPESPAQTGRPASGWLPQTPEPLTPVPKVHKTFLQWKAEAQATTAEYQRNGFPSPVAWVYVEGHAIPRMLSSGGWTAGGHGILPGQLGKAGRHFRLGANISYHGKERDIDTYEVLVEANLPTRWVYQSFPSQPLPRALDPPIVPLEPRPQQATLADFKLVVIVDDSDSVSLHDLI
ncbi:hypothetical protein BJV74DRAFT_833438 [Russula compacta]|nr:hypothetical protein BJV74DRAFT_833438 [Russula compacta]